MLCNACERLTIAALFQAASDHPPGSKTGWNQAGYLILHTSFSALISSSQHGCTNCTLYLNHFSHIFPNVSERAAHLEHNGSEAPVIAFIVIANWNGDKGRKQCITKLQLQIGAQPWKAGDDERMCVAFRISQPRNASKNKAFQDFDFRYTEIDHNLGSEANFQLAKDWIQTCCKEHDKTICPPIEETELPTRLIDVCFDDPKLVLASPGQKGRYLALSHCWGPSVIGERLITVRGNLSLRRSGIPLSLMPANFRDACIATRKLGYQYLWIDSLCIIQDSQGDWETESAKMGDIYMKASLTLAAAAAKSSDGGMFETGYEKKDFKDFEPSKWFLEDRKRTNRYALSDQASAPTSHGPKRCRIPLLPRSEVPTAELTPWLPFSDLEENWYRCVVVGPLAHRGWTLQERTLSPRSIYYGNRQIYWQCPSSRLAADGESLPLGSTTSVWNISDHEQSEWPDLLSLRQLSRPLDSEQERRVHDLWRNVLRIYAGRLLTKQSDKLPALAGMAAFVHSITDDEYLASFWRRDLLVSLLWTPVPIWAKGIAMLDYVIQRPQWELPDPFISAPSWSWAGADVRGRLDFWTANEENRLWRSKDVQVLRTEMDVAGQNPFGAVKQGRLTLKGYVYPRWDGRVEGWNPLQVGHWKGAIDAGSEYTCLHSSRFEIDRVVLWDYPARHSVRILPKFFRLLAQLFWSIVTIVVWQGIGLRERIEKVHDEYCPYCVKCLNLHILSSVDNEPRRDLKTGKRFNQVGLWALILESVEGQENTYRRIGISQKIVEMSEEQYRDIRATGLEPPSPVTFEGWKVETVTII